MPHQKDREDGSLTAGPQEDLEAELARARAELDVQRHQIEALERSLERAQMTLDAVVGSLSWRITLPVRWGSSRLRTVAGQIWRRCVAISRLAAGTRLAWWFGGVFLPGRPRLLHLAGEAKMPPRLGDRRIARAANAANELSHAAGGGPGGAQPVDRLRLIAFYLPQFHPIPENDEWWGEGFTEWTNTVKARPQFEGHYQPQQPTELGYYDLRDPEVLEKQAALAHAYGISGFCFHYYWFNGRRILERPIDQMLESGRPTMPFCFCWANENWTRRWDGRDGEILLQQDTRAGWADRFIRDLLPALVDPRYLRVGGSPLVVVYRAPLLSEAERVTERWRLLAQREAGIDLHLAAVETYGVQDPRRLGFDSAVEFPPPLGSWSLDKMDVPGLVADHEGRLYDYRRAMRDLLSRPIPHYPWYRGVMPSWDNTARRGRHGHIYLNSAPSEYALWLRKLVLQTLIRAESQEPLIFVNAWNEWAEGCHLEPDDRYGRAWLEATREGLCDGIRQYYAYVGERISAGDALDRLERGSVLESPGLAAGS